MQSDDRAKLTTPSTIYILGAGAVGMALAGFLTAAGRHAVAVRTSRDTPPARQRLKIGQPGENTLETSVETTSLSCLGPMDNGLIIVAAKAHANKSIASELASRGVRGPIVVMQNGLGVEDAFLEAGLGRIHRCVLYMTSQSAGEGEIAFRSISSSPIGPVHAEHGEDIAGILTTFGFPFHDTPDIRPDIWKKTIINSVFNSICPLLDADNGIFFRSEGARDLAGEIIEECTGLAKQVGVALTVTEIMEKVMAISRGSDGQLISTLQDIRAKRPTEIEYLNLALARLGEREGVNLPKTRLLGRMILQKSLLV